MSSNIQHHPTTSTSMGISPDLTDFPTFILLNASPLTSTGHRCLILYFFFALPQFLLLAISHWWRQLWMVGFTFTWETSKRDRTGQWDWTFHFLQYLVSMDGSSRYVLEILWGNIKKALMVKSAQCFNYGVLLSRHCTPFPWGSKLWISWNMIATDCNYF